MERDRDRLGRPGPRQRLRLRPARRVRRAAGGRARRSRRRPRCPRTEPGPGSLAHGRLAPPTTSTSPTPRFPLAVTLNAPSVGFGLALRDASGIERRHDDDAAVRVAPERHQLMAPAAGPLHGDRLGALGRRRRSALDVSGALAPADTTAPALTVDAARRRPACGGRRRHRARATSRASWCASGRPATSCAGSAPCRSSAAGPPISRFPTATTRSTAEQGDAAGNVTRTPAADPDRGHAAPTVQRRQRPVRKRRAARRPRRARPRPATAASPVAARSTARPRRSCAVTGLLYAGPHRRRPHVHRPRDRRGGQRREPRSPVASGRWSRRPRTPTASAHGDRDADIDSDRHADGHGDPAAADRDGHTDPHLPRRLALHAHPRDHGEARQAAAHRGAQARPRGAGHVLLPRRAQPRAGQDGARAPYRRGRQGDTRAARRDPPQARPQPRVTLT